MPILHTNLIAICTLVFLILTQNAYGFSAPFNSESTFSVDLNQFAFRTIFTYQQKVSQSSFSLPRMELLYRFNSNGEFDIALPFELKHQSNGASFYNFGSAAFDLNLRLYESSDTSWLPSLGIGPEIHFPSAGSPEIGSSYFQTYIPIIIEEDIGQWSLLSNIAYGVNPGNNNSNYWFAGGVITYRIFDYWDVGSEVYYRSRQSNANPEVIGFNMGTKIKFQKGSILYFSAGQAFDRVDQNNLISLFLGFQLQF